MDRSEDRSGLQVPESLDDIVRRNRHLFEIGLPDAADIANVVTTEDLTGTVRGRIDDWRLIAFRYRVLGQTMLHVLGHFEDGRAWITSPVTAIASDQSRVRTCNSLYDLGPRSKEEPDLLLRLHIAAALHAWGIDACLKLGVLGVTYDA